MSIAVSIVIVTYRSRRVIGACLDSLRDHVDATRCEVIVVDNASRDDTASFVERAHPWVRLIRRSSNDGLSAAINDGVAASSGRCVMQLNPDVRITNDVFAPLARYLDEHADVGVVAPKLLNDDGSLQMSCRAFPAYATALFSRYSALTKLLPGNRFSRDYLMSDFDHASARDVDWVSGAALMFPRAVFDRLGGWDAGYFMFNEDVDFCHRVHDARLHVVYEPAVAVFHSIGASESPSTRLIIERHRSIWRYYRKHLRGNVIRDSVTAVGIASRCVAVLVATQVRRLGAARRSPGDASV